MKHFHIITLFPKSIETYCNLSIIGDAKKRGLYDISFYNPLDYVEKGLRVDDKAYGGGPGMVLRAEPILKAYEDVVKKTNNKNKEKNSVLFLSREGEQVDTPFLNTLYEKEHIVLISGRYEGIDARVQKITNAQTVSVGNATLTGGEIACMYIIDSYVRMIPEVLGNQDSLEQRRHASHDVYTRPQTLTYDEKTYSVPETLISGNHKDIDEWRKAH